MRQIEDIFSEPGVVFNIGAILGKVSLKTVRQSTSRLNDGLHILRETDTRVLMAAVRRGDCLEFTMDSNNSNADPMESFDDLKDFLLKNGYRINDFNIVDVLGEIGRGRGFS